jgi:hypothetical protein
MLASIRLRKGSSIRNEATTRKARISRIAAPTQTRDLLLGQGKFESFTTLFVIKNWQGENGSQQKGMAPSWKRHP